MRPQSGFYVWKPAGKSISVHFDFAVIDALRSAILNAPHSEEGRRDEIGGLLLGRVEPVQNVIVDGFELLSSEHKRGASFILSARDGEKLGTRLQWWSEHHNEREPIGFFRSHTRPGLYLDRNDQEVISRFFARPSDVALLVRPEADSSCIGGAFFWEDVAVHGTESYLEFPFDTRRLAPESYVPAVSGSAKPALVVPFSPPRNARWRVASVGAALLLLPLLGVYAFRANVARAPAVHAERRDPAHARHRVMKPPERSADTDENIEGLPVIEERVNVAPTPRSRDRRPANVPAANPRSVTVTAPKTTPSIPPPPPLEGKPAVHVALAPTVSANTKMAVARPPSATVVLEPVDESIFRRAANRVPVISLLQRHRYKAGDHFFPAKPVRDPAPSIPRELRSKVSGVVPVDLKITVDKKGSVEETELLSKKVDPDLADLAVRTASGWDFSPARINSRPVKSEMLVHMQFQEGPRP